MKIPQEGKFQILICELGLEVKTGREAKALYYPVSTWVSGRSSKMVREGFLEEVTPRSPRLRPQAE